MSRQFLMLCDDAGVEMLKAVFRETAIQFLEVQGMNVNADNKFNILVTPVNPPVTPANLVSTQPTEQPVGQVDEVKDV